MTPHTSVWLGVQALVADPASAALLWFCSQQKFGSEITEAMNTWPQHPAEAGLPHDSTTAPGAAAPAAAHTTDPAWMLGEAARLVSGSAFLWEMAASARAISLLDELSAEVNNKSQTRLPMSVAANLLWGVVCDRPATVTAARGCCPRSRR